MAEFTTMLLVTTVAGSATGLGALPVFVRQRVSHRTYDATLGLAAGIMVAASVFGLILPGIDEGSLRPVAAGIFVGGFALLGSNRLIPHVHARYRGLRASEASDADPERLSTLRRATLVGSAITLHNAPEGLAMGVAFASGLDGVAFLLAAVIGLQNVPDGFAFAVPLSDTGVSNWRVLLYATLSGAVPEVGAALLGYSVVGFAAGIFPAAAGFAAGAMLAVVFREMVPSSHGHGYADAATATFLVGFVLLMAVDALLVV